jgi:predicted nucleic acid-binding protein
LPASADTGPLIWLGKCDALHLLKKLYHENEIRETVYIEAVTRGLEKGHEDAQIIKKTMEKGRIRVSKPGEHLIDRVEEAEKKLGIQLGRGEREAIVLSIEREVSLFLTNDEDAYQTGKSLGLELKGILYVLLEAVKEGHLSSKEAKEFLSQTLEEGFCLSPIIINVFHEALNRLRKT